MIGTSIISYRMTCRKKGIDLTYTAAVCALMAISRSLTYSSSLFPACPLVAAEDIIRRYGRT